MPSQSLNSSPVSSGISSLSVLSATRHNPAVFAPRMVESAGPELWTECKGLLSREVSPAFFTKFIEPLEVVDEPEQDSGVLMLAAPNAKHKKHIEQRYLALIRETLQSMSPSRDRVMISIAQDYSGQTLVPREQARHRASFETQPVVTENRPTGFFLEGHQPAAVNRADLDRLWQGGCGAGCLNITGASGSGKTAIARAYVRLQIQRGIPTRYMTAEEFLTEFSLACKKRENISWRQTLRAHHVLVIDDFQFIKPQALRSQEELQYLVDEFQENGQLLILCSDREATDQGLTPALLSRLQAGHRIQLAYPAHVEREIILKDAGHELDLAREHITYLAGRISRDMRHLKSAIRRLVHAREMKGDVSKSGWTSNELDQVCADLYTRRPPVPPERVRQVVAEFFQLSPEAITGPIRDKQHALARHMTAYLCTEHLQLSLKETAVVIGRREHGSVIHARKKIEVTLERDLFFRKQMQELTEKIFVG